MIFKGSKNKRGRRGQALVEFSLSLGILLFLIFGILEFGRVLFAYSSASDSLRSALRNATILGVEEGGGTRPYLDCPEMQGKAQNNFFTGAQTITIGYEKTDGSGLTYSCDGVGDPLVSDSVLDNGDLLIIDLDTSISPLWFRFVDTLDINLKGQRTIIKLIVPGAGVGDEDFDGLLDVWEETHFGDIDSNGATDDPDGDGCNNGCEEEAGTDPNDINSYPTGIGNDPDGDGIETNAIPPDNCPTVSNVDQLDSDADGTGDVCEDDDNDNVYNANDNCLTTPNPSQANNDGDSEGDACDTDDDNDGIFDAAPDNCPFFYDISNTCSDADSDGFYDGEDNCPSIPNPGQENSVTPNDGTGDACEDPDSDSVYNDVDNCPFDPNTNQADTTPANGIGDACEDYDGDGVNNGSDNCPTIPNPAQDDVCSGDSDTDGVLDITDNCPDDMNANQEDNEPDGIGDACDPDDDNDGINDTDPDNCPFIANADQQNNDAGLGDTQGDACDTDDDNDGVADASDNCQFTANPLQTNNDGDSSGDECDDDDDNDGVDDDDDNCPLIANTSQIDSDQDNIGDICDPTPDPTGTGQITVILQDAKNANCDYNSTYFNVNVIITNQGTQNTYQGTTSGSGGFTFTNLPAANFSIDAPNSTSGGNLISVEDNVSSPTCFASVSDPVSITLAAGGSYTVKFGYK